MGRKVTIICEGEASVHMADPNGNYATACGMDGNDDDPSVDQVSVPTARGAKIDCPQCIALWLNARDYRAGDFATPAKGESNG